MPDDFRIKKYDGLKEMYRMPVIFGPSAGPRNLPADKEHLRYVKDSLNVSMTILTDRNRLTEMVPPRCTVAAEPVVTIAFSYMTNIGWLAGRGYSTAGIRIPVTYEGEEEKVTGSVLAVLWENLADPVLTGREELGFAKLYGEIPPARLMADRILCETSWLGFKFLELEASHLKAAPIDNLPPAPPTLHYKYMPRTGEWGKADVAYMCIGKGGTDPLVTVKQRLTGNGSVEIHAASWEDMPTQYHITRALASLPILEQRSASVVYSSGGSDIAGQRILR
jgi:hypothetical protein